MDMITQISASFPRAETVNPAQPKPPQTPREQEKKDSDLQTTLDQVSSQAQEILGMIDFKLNFSVDSDTQSIIAKVINAQTGKVIRQIPPSESLALAKSMKELQGLFFDKKI